MAAWGVDLYLLPESMSKDMLHMRCAYERDSNGDALHVLFALLFPKGGASRMLPRGDLQAHAASPHSEDGIQLPRYAPFQETRPLRSDQRFLHAGLSAERLYECGVLMLMTVKAQEPHALVHRAL